MFAKTIAQSTWARVALTLFLLAALGATAPAAGAQGQPELPDDDITMSVRLKGTAGGETFEFRIGTWVIASGEATTEWATIEATAPAYAFGDIEVAFINDASTIGQDESQGVDRNLIVDYLDLGMGDAVEHIESESPLVYSEGAFSGFGGCSPGFVQRETLGCAGMFVYGEVMVDGSIGPAIDPHGNQRGLPPADENDLDVVARGHFGGERFTVRVGGKFVGVAATTRHFRTYRFFVDPKLTGELEIIFEGDFFAEGIDTNLDVDYAELRGNHFEAEAETTRSTGTYTAADGCKPGFKQSQTLHCNGKFVFGDV